MTVTLDRATTLRTPKLPVWLSLASGGVRTGRLDGAWWPRSRDLLLELPDLAAELEKRWGRVIRITVNPAQWPAIPRRIPVAGHTVHVGWFTTEQDQHMITVFSYAPRRLDLLVIPPSTEAVDAGRLMYEAADPTSSRTASALLTAGGGDSAAESEFHSDFLPSAVLPANGPGEADRRAEVARTRAAAWPEPA
ncbi:MULTISPECIES: DUF5994 family protein [Kitasatospora]|uniref:Uncharacterized protein n=1 Tax=Kitasatospora cystarginea TaxID=58350 RepID=A0ABN3EWX1_9ACTN